MLCAVGRSCFSLWLYGGSVQMEIYVDVVCSRKVLSQSVVMRR